MAIDKIRVPDDPRISYRSAFLNGYTYGYLYSPVSPAAAKVLGTIVLIHGFPDISMGWRYQIPFLSSLGLEVIALDCLGYGRSDAPPTYEISAYTFKRIATDIAALCSQLGLSEVILGGHDWGGMVVYRVAQFQPNLVKAFFSICTPYDPPRPVHLPLAQLVATRVPNFGYQLHFVSGEVEKAVQSPQEIRQFLDGMYGGRIQDGSSRTFWVAEKGIDFSTLTAIGPNRLLTKEEMDYYVQEYARHGINGPLNWYRAREQMWVDDVEFFFPEVLQKETGKQDLKKMAERVKINQDCLFVLATKDTALPEWMSANMEARIPNLTRRTVQASHWALWEKPEEVNRIIGDWLQTKIFDADRGDESKSTTKSKL